MTLDRVTGLLVPELALGDIAEEVMPPIAKPGLGLRQATVTAIGSGTVTVQLGGGTQDSLPCKYLASYMPSVGDVVWVMRQGGDLLVLGTVAGAAGSNIQPRVNGVTGVGAWNNSTAVFGVSVDWVPSTVLGLGPSLVPNAKAIITGKIRIREQVVGYGGIVAWLGNYSSGTIVTPVGGTGVSYIVENEVGIDGTHGITNTLQFMVDLGAEGTSLLIGWVITKLAGSGATVHIQTDPPNTGWSYMGWGLA